MGGKLKEREDKVTRYNIHLIGITGSNNRDRKWGRCISKVIMNEKFPELMKYSNP